jgi:TRAP transporter T-component
MLSIHQSKVFLVAGVLCLSLSGCFSSQQLITDKAAGLFQDISEAANRQSDVTLVRQGLPSYLILIDGLIQSNPENKDLLLAGAQAYASYASLLEEEDSSRTGQLIQKAKTYALKALELEPLFEGAQGNSLDLFRQQLGKAPKSQAPFLFKVGSIWGTWIAEGPDSIEGMADLPKVEILMDRVLQLDPGYYYGGPHLFKAILLAARPVQYGGNLKKAEAHFKQALKYGHDKFLMTYVYYAQYYARQRLDKDLYIRILNQVLSTPADIDPDLTLINTLAKEKAKRLLDQVDEYF